MHTIKYNILPPLINIFAYHCTLSHTFRHLETYSLFSHTCGWLFLRYSELNYWIWSVCPLEGKCQISFQKRLYQFVLLRAMHGSTVFPHAHNTRCYPFLLTFAHLMKNEYFTSILICTLSSKERGGWTISCIYCSFLFLI